jgi:RecA/RadA recombinase
MQSRVALSFSLDGAQKAAFLRHSIWSQDAIPPDELDLVAEQLDIPRVISISRPFAAPNPRPVVFHCGLQPVDELLSTFLSGCVTEICGLPGSGRTTLCLRYARHHKTLWIDTEGCLCPPEGTTLSLMRIHDHIQLFALIYKLRGLVEKTDPELIVIDSIAGPLRGEASGENVSRTPLLCDLGNLLKSLAAERGLAVLVTNHMSKLQFHGFVRTLGQAWAHIPVHCIEAKKTGMGDHYLRVLKSPCIRRSDIQLLTSTE